MTSRPADSEKRRLMRHATALAASKYTVNGTERKQQVPKQVSLPKVRFLEEEE